MSDIPFRDDERRIYPKNIKLSRKKLMSFTKNKNDIHIEITNASYDEIKILMFRKKLNLTDVLEECVQRLLLGDEYMMCLLDDLLEIKRKKEITKLNKIDADEVFNVINNIDNIDNDSDDDILNENES